jgi:hypothetical protein
MRGTETDERHRERETENKAEETQRQSTGRETERQAERHRAGGARPRSAVSQHGVHWCNMLHRAQETERLREAVRLSESAEQSMAETLLNLQALAHAP